MRIGRVGASSPGSQCTFPASTEVRDDQYSFWVRWISLLHVHGHDRGGPPKLSEPPEFARGGEGVGKGGV